MTPRQARRERRAAERKTRKAEIKRTKAGLLPDADLNFHTTEDFAHIAISASGFVSQKIAPPEIVRPDADVPTEAAPPEIGFVSQIRAETNRANAQHSTGPRSSAGKLASSRNSTKHGLASGQLIIPGEDLAEFESLLADLLDDHQPADHTEALLVKEMAQSHWLGQRALRLQNDCFTENGVDQKNLALFLRYGTTHHRAFHKALTDLQHLQQERRKQERGFVSQIAAKSAAVAGFVSQNKRGPTHEDEFSRQNDPAIQIESGFVSQTATSARAKTMRPVPRAA